MGGFDPRAGAKAMSDPPGPAPPNPADPAWPAQRSLDTRALSPAEEDYLIGIAVLAEAGGPVTGVRLAQLLMVSAPSVTQMLHRLTDAGLLLRGQTRGRVSSLNGRGAGREDATGRAATGLGLTANGVAIAAWLLLRRRVCECLLVDGLGFNWVDAHYTAHELEHGLTAAGVQRLHDALGAPTRCPHGNSLWLEGLPRPIPAGAALDATAGRGGRAPQDGESPTMTLADAPLGTSMVVVRVIGVAEQDPESLIYLECRGIGPGQRLIVEERTPEGKALSLRLGRRRCLLPVQVAAHIAIRLAEHTGRRVSASVRPVVPPGPCREGPHLRLTAVRVDGPCAAGHQPGDSFVLSNETPTGLCGPTYAALFPWLRGLLAAARTAAEPGAPPMAIERRCPGEGHVTWRAEVLDNVVAAHGR